MRRGFFNFFSGKSPVPAAVLLCLALWSAAAAPGAPPRTSRVLLLAPFPLTHPWSMDTASALRRNLGRDGRCTIDFLEFSERPASAHSGRTPHCGALIAAGGYDLVVGISDAAAEKLKHANLPPDLPVAVAAYAGRLPEFRKRHAAVAAVTGELLLDDTVSLGLRLMPHARKVVIVADDIGAETLLQRSMNPLRTLFPEVSFRVISGSTVSTDRMLSEVEALGRDSFVIFAPWRRYKCDGYASLKAVANELGRRVQNPYFLETDVLMGSRGALGGYLSRSRSVGERLGELGRRMIAARGGAVPPDVFVRREPVIDMKVLRDYGLDPAGLPEETVRLNDEPGWIVEYAFEIILGLLGCLLGLVCAAYLRERRIRERLAAERRLRESEQLLRLLIDQLPGCVVIKKIDDGHRVLVCNAHFGELCGRTPEEAIGCTDFELFGDDPNLKQVFANDLAAEAQTGIFETTCGFRDGAGRQRFGRFLRQVVTTESGIRLLVLVMLDITEENRRSRHLAEVNSILRGICDNLPACVMLKDASDDYRYLVWNRMAEKITGAAAVEVLGHTDFEIPCLRSMAAKFRHEDEEACRLGSLEVAETFKAPDGTNFDFHSLRTRLDFADGRRGILLLSRDVTERNRASRNLRAFAERQQAVNLAFECALQESSAERAMTRILEMTVRRLGAARGAIFHYDEPGRILRLCEEFSADGAKPFRKIVGSGIVLTGGEPMIPRYRAGELVVVEDLRHPDAAALLDRFADDFSGIGGQSMTAAGLRWGGELWGSLDLVFDEKQHFDSSVLELVRAVAHVLELVLMRRAVRQAAESCENEKKLLLNSIGLPIVLYDENLQILYANRAACSLEGVDENMIYKQPCCRTFCGRSERPADCAVALARQDHLPHSEEMRIGGRDFRLTVYPMLAEGRLASLIAVLPDVAGFRADGAPPDAAVRAVREACPARSPVPEQSPEDGSAGSPLRILIVDDVAMNLNVMSSMLRRFAGMVETAASGEEAVEKIAANRPDAVLSDMWMPGMNGGEFAEFVRRKYPEQPPALIAVTADSEAENNFDMSVFDGVLLKPVTLVKLRNLLTELAAKGRISGGTLFDERNEA